MTRRTISDAERRARLGGRHRLGSTPNCRNTPVVDAADVAGVADDLVVLHATDPATIHLSISARLPGANVAGIDAALFDHRTVFRTLAMRRTLFVVTVGTAPVVEASSSVAVAADQRRKLRRHMAEVGIDDPDRWLDDLAAEVLDVLAADGAVADGLAARRLTEAVPRLATRIVVARGTRHATELSLTSRVLGLMAAEGMVIRGRPSGGWTNRLYRWHRRDRWWPEGEGPGRRPTEEAAAAGLVERYLQTFGPASLTDLVWWTGWTKTRTRQALARLDVVQVELEGEGAAEPGLLLASDADPVDPADLAPWAALLPALDPTPMGWKQRAWYLGDHQGPLFDRNGNIGPTVWVDGRIIGGWAQRPDGEVVVELLDDVGPHHRDLIDGEVARVQGFVGDTVVKPSFKTPLEATLARR